MKPHPSPSRSRPGTSRSRPAKSGPFARLRAFRRGSGTGAPSARWGLALAATLALVLLAPAPASAHFVRPFLHSIAQTTPGASLSSGGGIALDPAGDLWVDNGRLGAGADPFGSILNEFEPASHANAFLGSLELEGTETFVTAPESLAIDQSTGSFYLAGPYQYERQPGAGPEGHSDVEVFDHSGAFLERFGPFEHPAIAVDGSAAAVYVAAESPFLTAISKFSPAGAPETFSRALEPNPPSYLSSPGQITGDPQGTFAKEGGRISPPAVDPATGDIYIGVSGYETEPHHTEWAVLVYAPSGEFLRAVPGKEAPGLGEGEYTGCGFCNAIQGLAVDPSNGDLLVALATQGNVNGKFFGAVDEFSAGGAFLGQTAAAAGRPLEGAFDPTLDSLGDLYFVEHPIETGHDSHLIDAYAPGHFVPALRVAAPSAVRPQSALLEGSVDPESSTDPDKPAGLADCRFEYVTQEAFQASGFSDLSSGGEAPCESPDAAEVGETDSYVPVHAAVSGLAKGTTYRYRLSAATAGALGGADEHGPSTAFTAPAKPIVSATAAGQVTSTFATLTAELDPLGADTHYRFQYLTEAQFNAAGGFAGPSLRETPEADLGSGGSAGDSTEEVSSQISGLSPETTYRFRVLATSECEPETPGATCTSEGEAATFATLPPASPGLPDGRAYELLTPPDKGSAVDMFGEPAVDSNGSKDTAVVSESGDQLLLQTQAAFGPDPASGGNVYVFSRHPDAADPAQAEWSYLSLASPSLGVQSINDPLFDPADFSRVAVDDFVGSASSQAGGGLDSLLGPPGGPYALLHADQPAGTGEDKANTRFVGADRDLSYLVLASRDHALCPGAQAQDENQSETLCEYSGGQLRLLDAKTNGELLSPCGAALGAGDNEAGAKARGAVAADGSRAFFTAPDPDPLARAAGKGCWNGNVGEGAQVPPSERGKVENAPQLYQRSAGETTEVSAPAHGVTDPSGAHPVEYIAAAADGSRVFFRTEAELTSEALADHLHDWQLYEWRSPGTAGPTEGLGGPTGPCEESSPAYVAASQGCLTRVSAGESGHAAAEVTVVGAVSADGSAVYFAAAGKLTAAAEEGESIYRYATATGATALVSPGGGDQPTEVCGSNVPPSAIQQSSPCPVSNWYTTPDGRYFLFQGAQGQLLRYDSTTSGLLCVSCRPDGEPAPAQFANSAPRAGVDDAPPFAISNDGSYVFFETTAALLPTDTNGPCPGFYQACNDVYQWHLGHGISLISSGQSASRSYFLGASPDGRNVFIGTHARLVPADTDNQGDVYDARLCTESEPCIKPPPGKEGLCEADACSHPVPAPNDETPGSLTYHGPGNVKEEPARPTCPKGKVHKGKKCVAKHHKKSKNRHAKSNRRAGK